MPNVCEECVKRDVCSIKGSVDFLEGMADKMNDKIDKNFRFILHCNRSRPDYSKRPFTSAAPLMAPVSAAPLIAPVAGEGQSDPYAEWQRNQ